MASAFTMEKVLTDVRCLVSRLKNHETTADNLLLQTQDLSKKVDAMKTYQENLGTLNEMAKQRPPTDIVLGLFQENSEIGDLNCENACLRYSLDEHQLAIELIMSRYRDHVTKLVTINQLDRSTRSGSPDDTEDIDSKNNQICNMADVMCSAANIDSATDIAVTEQLTRLRFENASLRELLVAGKQSLASAVSTRCTQTVPDIINESSSSTSAPDDDASGVWNSSTNSDAAVFDVQSLAARVTRKRQGMTYMNSSSSPVFPDSKNAATSEAINERLYDDEFADDLDDKSSGTATPDFSSDVDGDNISVHTIGDVGDAD